MYKLDSLKFKLNASNKLIIIVIVILALTVILLSQINRNDTILQEGQVAIKTNNTIVGYFNLDDLKKMPSIIKEITIYSDKEGNSENMFTCVPLYTVLSDIDPGLLQKYQKIITRGVDNYQSGMDMSEVLQPDNVYLAYANFGQPLKQKNGEDGSIRVIICNDDFGQRSTYWLVSLELQ